MNGGVTERQTDRRKEGRTEGKTDGGTERRNVLRRCERLGLSLCAVPSLNGTVCLSIWKGRDHGKGLGKNYGRSAERRNKYGKME